ncbi:MAG: SDR family NAD(P)-dependent oxidoreductase, partial [Actinomycetes bacterium]
RRRCSLKKTCEGRSAYGGTGECPADVVRDSGGSVKSLDRRVAVVTGAGSGIGRAIARELAASGCRLALVDRDLSAAEATAELLPASAAPSAHLADVRDADRIAALPDEVLAEHGAVHVLVNNAGVTSAGSFADESVDDLRWIVDINVWGVVLGCRAFLPALLRSDEAHIVNMSSMVGLVGLPHNVSYSLTKGAVRSFSEALRAELVTTPVGLTVVFPGAIRTNITEGARGTEAQRLATMGRSRFAPLVMRPPELVARRVVGAIRHDRPRVVVGPDAHVVSALSRLFPGRTGPLGRLTNWAANRPSAGGATG